MQIKGSGPRDAKILLVCDNPGFPEYHTRKPLAGANENMLKMWWAKHKLYRDAVRVENLHEYLPKAGKIDTVPTETIVQSIQDFHHRLAGMRPNVIVPMGEYSTFALTGKGKVRADVRKAFGEDINTTMAEKKAGISSLRGSTYLYKGIKVIPTIHPKDIIRFEKWKKRTLRDWRIIIEESTTPDYTPITMTHINNPTPGELEAFSESIDVENDIMSIDIETWGKTLSCVGFAVDKRKSYTLPTVTKEDQALYMPWIKAFCECDVPKVGQNFLYDRYWLDHYGVKVNNHIYDTMAMHHALDPIESHDLAFLASYFTRNNYWKDEAKDAEEIKKYANDLSALWTYNGLDCCITREICDVLRKELEERGMWPFYSRHYAEIFTPLLYLMRHGVSVNVKKQKAWAAKLIRQAEKARQELAEVAGEDLFAKKGFSPVKVKRFFYETLGLPEQKKKSKRKGGIAEITAIDETAIKRMTLKFPKKIGTHGLKLLGVRSKLKKAGVLKKGWDKDERIRCTYKYTTEQGRLSSSKNPMGRGYNLQNIEREANGIRTTFIPDDGCIFVRVDLSQSEDRFCKMYCNTPRMVEQANLKPHEWDSHVENARIIFKTDNIDKALRNIGKMAVHASQRKMQGKTLSDRLMSKMDLVKTPKQCQVMINNYLTGTPEIERNYFPFVEKQIIQCGILANSWGRMIDFNGYLIDNNMYRKGYSFYLQSENSDLLMQLGIKFSIAYIKDNHLMTRVHMNVHDEVVASSPPNEAYKFGVALVKSLETPRQIMGNWLSVPANLTIGTTWDSSNSIEFKVLPTEDEFNVKMEELLCQ